MTISYPYTNSISGSFAKTPRDYSLPTPEANKPDNRSAQDYEHNSPHPDFRQPSELRDESNGKPVNSSIRASNRVDEDPDVERLRLDFAAPEKPATPPASAIRVS